MKILFCNTIKSWGGGEKWHYDTACDLAQHGYDIYFLRNKTSILSTKLQSEPIKSIDVDITNLSFLNPFKVASSIIQLIKIKPDAIIINRPAELKIYAPAAKIAGIKKIIYRRGSDVVVKKTLFNRLLLEKIVTHIIANSTATKNSLLKTGLKIEKKISIIHNGIKIPSPQTDFQIKNDIPIIAAAGRLDNVKGFDLLILIAESLKKINSRFRIEIAGEGSERQRLEQMIAERDLKQHVILKGFNENIHQFFHSCNLFVLTSRYEGFGFVIVEAMIARKAIIAYNLSSTGDIIDDNETGFLITPFQIDEFTKKIDYLLNNESLALEMGVKGYERASKLFSIEKANEKLITFLNQ